MRKLIVLIGWTAGFFAFVIIGYVGFAAYHEISVDTSEYNYRQYSASQYGFGEILNGPGIGEQAVDFTVTDVEGKHHRLSDYRGKYVVLETGSLTCPMYVSRINPMNTIAAAHPDIAFLTLYVREAHPGDKIAAHNSFNEKLDLAKRVKMEEQESRTILVDSIGGEVHKSYGAWPNMVYIIAPDGRVAFRGVWNDPSVVNEAISRLKAGGSVADLQTKLTPNPIDITQRVLSRAGGHAVTDFIAAIGPAAAGHIFEEVVDK